MTPRQRLEVLLKSPDNQVCADCPERGPRWASATMGTFICIKCSGIHRNLGVHISFVRSVNLDEWKTEHVEQMERWGNGRARAYFEAEVPSSYARPSDWSNVQQMTKWIRDKYEYKRFLPRDGSVPERQPVAASRAPGSSNEPFSSSSRERKPRDRPSPTPSSLPLSSSSSSTPVLVKAKAAPAPIVDLLDFTAPDPTPPPPSVPASCFNFDASVAAAAAPPPSLPPSLPTVEMTSSGKPKLTTDQLLSMFMTPAAPPQQQQQQQQQQPGMYGGQGFAQPGYPYHQQQQQQPQHHHQQQHHHQHHQHHQYHQQHQQQQHNPFGPPPSGGGGGMMGGMGEGMAPPQHQHPNHQQQQQHAYQGMTSMMPHPSVPPSFPPAYPPQQQQQQQQQPVWPPQPQQGGMNSLPF